MMCHGHTACQVETCCVTTDSHLVSLDLEFLCINSGLLYLPITQGYYLHKHIQRI